MMGTAGVESSAFLSSTADPVVLAEADENGLMLAETVGEGVTITRPGPAGIVVASVTPRGITLDALERSNSGFGSERWELPAPLFFRLSPGRTRGVIVDSDMAVVVIFVGSGQAFENV